MLAVDMRAICLQTSTMRKTMLYLVATALLTPLGWAQQVPVFEVTPVSSAVTFNVKSSVSIVGKFTQWKSTLTMTSPDVTTAAIDIEVQSGSVDTDVPGTFTIRGVSKAQTLQLTLAGTKGSGQGDIKGAMYFDRKDYGMNGSIPFVTIADRVEVDVNLKVKRVSGPPVVFKQ
jgi:polyisoprenoid-binding protein YceI